MFWTHFMIFVYHKMVKLVDCFCYFKKFCERPTFQNIQVSQNVLNIFCRSTRIVGCWHYIWAHCKFSFWPNTWALERFFPWANSRFSGSGQKFFSGEKI